MKTKILAICASPRKGDSFYVAQKALEAAAEVDPRIETELISFAGKKIEPCNGCNYCKENKCWCIKNDDMQIFLLIRPESGNEALFGSIVAGHIGDSFHLCLLLEGKLGCHRILLSRLNTIHYSNSMPRWQEHHTLKNISAHLHVLTSKQPLHPK